LTTAFVEKPAPSERKKQMPQRKRWVFDPDSGGVKIPESVKRDVAARINRVAEENFEGKYTRLDIRFKGQFCYIDAYCEVKNAGRRHRRRPL
jgi:hypothetical protein